MGVLSVEQLKEKLAHDERIVLLDVRGDDAYNNEHIPGAKSAPVGALNERIGCCTVKGAEIITYCGSESCTASTEAAKRLENLGYFNVSRFSGGIRSWKEAGLDTVSNVVH